MSSEPLAEFTVPLPRGRTECAFSMCDDKPIATFRCSTCKNQFYCSVQCQNRDWKSHKYNCSPLNGPSVGILTGKDFDDELERMNKIMTGWAFRATDAQDPTPKSLQRACSLPESRVLRELEQSALLPQYTREPPESSKYPFRRPLVLIARIFLNDFVAQIPPEDKKTFEDYLVKQSDSLPRDGAIVYGPKFTTHPADLSPGEYMKLPSVALYIMFNFFGKQIFSREFQIRWVCMQVAIHVLWDAPVTACK